MDMSLEVMMQSAHQRLETLRRETEHATLVKEANPRKHAVAGRGLRLTLTLEWTPARSPKY